MRNDNNDRERIKKARARNLILLIYDSYPFLMMWLLTIWHYIDLNWEKSNKESLNLCAQKLSSPTDIVKNGIRRRPDCDSHPVYFITRHGHSPI